MQATLTDQAGASRTEAIDWARQHVVVHDVEQIRSNDWAQTYRLSGGGIDAFLKQVPANRAHQLGHMASIARRFPGRVPQVLAFDEQRGWLLTADHQARDLDEDEPDEIEALLIGLAQMQAQATAEPSLIEALDRFDPSHMPQLLLRFLELDPDAQNASVVPVGAARIIGKVTARRYLDLLRPRIQLLADHIGRSSGLPATLIHGDLHAGNAAVRDDGSCVLIDWDECAAGPAGSCLHGVFDGSTMPAILLSRWLADGQPLATPQAKQLAAYVGQLEADGYAGRTDLLRGLAGAICAGQIRFVITYGQFPYTRAMKHTANKIEQLLDDLLDLCDWLCAADNAMALAFAADYAAQHEWSRAQRLLQDQVARFPERPDLLVHFGMLSRRSGDYAVAAEACLEAVRLAPGDAPSQLELARIYLESVDLPACRKALQAALALDSENVEAQHLQARLEEFESAVDRAAEPEGWAQIRISAEERAQGHLHADTKALLLHLFHEHGVVQIDEVFEPAFVESLHQAFLQRYQRQLDEKKQQNHLQVGDKRFMLTLEMDDVFGSPDFVASGLLLPTMQQILGKDCILGAYTAVISLPGSEDQQFHKDHTPLYEEAGWDLDLPCFAAQIILPLVRMDENTGTTRCFKDTQGIAYDDAADLPTFDPIVPQGSCLLIDYATVHQGLANRSGRVRPIVAMAYSRPWFRDVWNYHLQPPMRFTSDYFNQAPPTVRKLIAWREIERITVKKQENPPE